MIKNINLLTLVAAFFAVCLFGCTSDVDLDINGAESRIFFYAELEANSSTAFRYSTTTGLADKLETVNPTFTSEFDMTFRENEDIINPSFRYNPITGLFECPSVAFTPQEGAFYHIKTSLKEFSQLQEVFASTYVHEAKEFESLEILSLTKTGNEFGLEFDMNVRFSVSTDHQYYEVLAYVYDTDDYIDPIKEISLHLLKQNPGVIELPQRSSLVVDAKKNKGQYVDVMLNASIPEHILSDSGAILFKLKTVNKEHHEYHLNMAKRYESQNAPLSEPVISYTNIENGLGLFSGYSSIVDSLHIQ